MIELYNNKIVEYDKFGIRSVGSYILFRERMPKIQETLASGDQEAIAKLIGTMPFTVWHQTAVRCTKCEWHRNTKVVF